MNKPLLQVKNLRVEFPTRRGTLLALDDVSFDIAPGEILGVVGESGAGKSLTGAAIIGLLEPPGRVAGGEIRLTGERIDQLPAHGVERVQRGEWVLKDGADALAADLAHGLMRQVVDARAIEQDLPTGHPAGWLQQADDGRAGERLAGAGFTHHAQDFARRDIEVDVVQGQQRAVAGGELDTQMFDFEQRGGHLSAASD